MTRTPIRIPEPEEELGGERDVMLAVPLDVLLDEDMLEFGGKAMLRGGVAFMRKLMFVIGELDIVFGEVGDVGERYWDGTVVAYA